MTQSSFKGYPPFLEALRQQAADWDSKGLRRQRKTVHSATSPHIQLTKDCKPSVSFLSNDYLGLAAHPELRQAVSESAAQWGVGAGASALISGHMECHQEAESALAQFTGFEAALLFITGYMANLAVITSLLSGSDDVVFSDSLNHASLIDACRLSRARIERYPHCDTETLAQMLDATPARRRLIVTDAVFSMDGDCADLKRLLSLAEDYDALLFVDDAHGFGVRGPQGRGSLALEGLESDRLIMMGTLGKAAGLSGAFVAASAFLIEHFVQHARTYVFSTAPSPALVGAIPKAIELIQAGDSRRAHLMQLYDRFVLGSRAWRYPIGLHGTPIIPVMVGGANEAMNWVKALVEQSVYVAGIRPPTVPEGGSRLRLTLSAAHCFDDLEVLLNAAERVGLSQGGQAHG